MFGKSALLILICGSAWAQAPTPPRWKARRRNCERWSSMLRSFRWIVSISNFSSYRARFLGLAIPPRWRSTATDCSTCCSVARSQTGPRFCGKADPILVVNRDGKILRSWGKGMYKIPHSIRIDPRGNVWTVDASSSMVYKFTPKGEKLMEISVGGQPASKQGFNGTTDIAFAPNGHLYISDGYGNARVLEYTAEGKRVREWGSAGSGPGQFRQPHGIAVDDDGVVYVADRQNGRLQRFDLTGKYLGEWANLGMCTSVVIRGGDLWLGTQQRNEPTTSAGWIMKIDRRSGKIVGLIGSQHGHHVVNVSLKGDVTSGARPDTVLWFRGADKVEKGN